MIRIVEPASSLLSRNKPAATAAAAVTGAAPKYGRVRRRFVTVRGICSS